MSIPPSSIELIKKVSGVSETYLKMYKNSQVLTKKMPGSYGFRAFFD